MAAMIVGAIFILVGVVFCFVFSPFMIVWILIAVAGAVFFIWGLVVSIINLKRRIDNARNAKINPKKRMDTLDALYQQSVITEEEYNRQKAVILYDARMFLQYAEERLKSLDDLYHRGVITPEKYHENFEGLIETRRDMLAVLSKEDPHE